jgi:hypothetical protein
VVYSCTLTKNVTASSLRQYIGAIREDSLTARLQEIFSAVHTHGFTPLEFKSHPKDGGIFVRFRYTPGPGTETDIRDALDGIRTSLEKEASKQGGIPNWIGLKGKPWNEVCKLSCPQRTAANL